MFSACVAWWFTKKFEEHNVESKRKDNSQPSAAVEMELELNITVRPGVECEQREAMCDRVVCERDVEACPPELEGAVSEEPGVSQSAGSSAEKGSESMRFLLFQGLALFAGLIGEWCPPDHIMREWSPLDHIMDEGSFPDRIILP
jgi:hypothetical protein